MLYQKKIVKEFDLESKQLFHEFKRIKMKRTTEKKNRLNYKRPPHLFTYNK